MKRKIFKIIDIVYFYIESRMLFKKVRKSVHKKNVFLFASPTHSNLGDQAQTYCIEKWLKENYKEYNLVKVSRRVTLDKTFNFLLDNISFDDIIFIHSGYLMFDPHPDLPFINKVVSSFVKNRVIILPQTINLNVPEIINKTCDIFNNHPDLTLLCRDEVSFSKANKLFSNCRIILFPDFVTSLIGKRFFDNKRKGVMFCLRNDGEKLYSDAEYNVLKKELKDVNITTFDTTISKPAIVWKYNREKLLNEVLFRFSKYRLVITDRYHGTIFSVIAKTPVIVLSSTDHKLSSGVAWFPETYKNRVKFASDLDEALRMANQILQSSIVIKDEDYFDIKYFQQLKTVLSE